jgi:hypothetical protein
MGAAAFHGDRVDLTRARSDAGRARHVGGSRFAGPEGAR